MKRPLHIEVGFDFICPWCLIGLRNLQQAIVLLRAVAPEADVSVAWRGVQLLPDVPAAGWPFMEFYRRRLGGDAAVRARQAMVVAAAGAAGARIDYARIGVMPNTADAHRLLLHAAREGGSARRDALLERLFSAYFERGEDLADRAMLLEHAAACGIDGGQLADVLLGADVPFEGGGAASRTSGVPSFSINGKLALTGAQPPEVLLAALRQALEQSAGPVQ